MTTKSGSGKLKGFFGLDARKEESWEGTFEEYFDMVVATDRSKHLLTRGAHQYINEMIRSYGTTLVSVGANKVEEFDFFKDEMYGVEDDIRGFMEYITSAAMGHDVRKRILLMYGPPSSGKSTLATLIKRGMEAYSRTDEGALYQLSDCPQQSDPLLLIPQYMRAKIESEFGIAIEGDVSPRMAHTLEEDYNGDIWKVKINRFFISERDRKGIGTFVPSDSKTQEMSELVGSLDLSTIGTYGSESDPRAYRFDGEINIANRGMMEFVELLKADRQFLNPLLTLTEERRIKIGRFSQIFCDEFLLAHTNENEYKDFLANDKFEALHDRVVVRKMGYNLKINEEVKIYEKLLRHANIGDTHIAPHTLKIAAIFAVLSRLSIADDGRLTLMSKARLYNGEQVDGFTARDVDRIKRSDEREGLSGISPRFITNRIAAAFVANPDSNTITPVDVLRSIREGFDTSAQFNSDTKEALETLIHEARGEYDALAKADVQKAFFVSFDHEIRALLSNYADNILAYLDSSDLENEFGETIAPDENFMRAIEENVGVSEAMKETFRNEVARKVSAGIDSFDYTQHPKLKKALEEQLFEERRDTIKLTVTSRNPDPEAIKRINKVVESLVEHYGYNEASANMLLRYVQNLMARDR